MLEPHISVVTIDEYEDVLRSRWHLYNKVLSPQHWASASKCLRLQSEYAHRQLFTPLYFVWEDKKHLFLQLNGQYFASNEEKLQFVKEVKYLAKIDGQVQGVDSLNLSSFLSNNGYQPENPNVVPLIQIFIQKRQD